MAILGAHLSIAGGFHKAVETAHLYGCDCLQLFTKNNTQWRARPISPEDVRRFRAALAASGPIHPIAHASYLINLASPEPTLWHRSIDAFVLETASGRRTGTGVPRDTPGRLHHQYPGLGPAADRPGRWTRSPHKREGST